MSQNAISSFRLDRKVQGHAERQVPMAAAVWVHTDVVAVQARGPGHAAFSPGPRLVSEGARG